MNIPGTSKSNASDVNYGLLRQVAVEKVCWAKLELGLCTVLQLLMHKLGLCSVSCRAHAVTNAGGGHLQAGGC